MFEWNLTSYRRGIRTSLRNNASAYGYSIVATADFATLSHYLSPPDLLEIYSFIIGAVAAFALLEAFSTRMFREKLRGEKSDVVALGSAFSVFSISVAVGVTALAAWLIDHWWAWPISAFASTVAYLLVVGVEMALAASAEKQHKSKQREGE